ncbi:MAG: SUMF1/EgtB/PvdO family nonheme iron enzyme [Chloroflexi bacterium]|nr:SUMF1/EgtB/PvdO family nonheme iron enzyme [Chloroflexota bacterium]
MAEGGAGQRWTGLSLGKDWDPARCNHSVGKDGNTNAPSPVRQYEGKGDSAFGVVDMAGNVWEWCSTAYVTGSYDLNGTDVRVLRGGSWGYAVTGDFRCAFRQGGPVTDASSGVSSCPLFVKFWYSDFCSSVFLIASEASGLPIWQGRSQTL